MCDNEDYLTTYRKFFEHFAATVNPEDQLPVQVAGYTITEEELPGEVLYWTTQYLIGKECPTILMTPLRRIILDEVREASKKQPGDFGFRSDDSVYIALRLMQAVTSRVNDVCLRYLDNAKLDTLPPPPPPQQRPYRTTVAAAKNSRRVMEDRHVDIDNLEALFGMEDGGEPTRFYAVYDGHAGSAAAVYCAAHLHQYLVESAYFRTDLRRALVDAFLRTDELFISKSNQERAAGGSTAVAVAVRGRRLLAAWAGDSQALLAKRMRLMQLVSPHKPDRPDERERIIESGGTIVHWGTWRVNGQLAVSRAIGDVQYKPYVTARPEIDTVDLDGDEDFLVIACDGLWDFVSEDQVAWSVYRQLAENCDDLKSVSAKLISQSKHQGSTDNITAIVVFLKEPRDIVADNNSPPMDFGLENSSANASPPSFAVTGEACRRQLVAGDVDKEDHLAAAAAGNGVDNNGVDQSDSDSEDLGPETAVDADDIDADTRVEAAPPTPPAHTVETVHVEVGLVDNVGESGEDSEDEWNYFKGEGKQEQGEPNASEEQLSETPGQDNSAWESSSVDMNSSPLNPEAPAFVPCVGGDLVLAESPRKPLPMDDVELPDAAQFRSGAGARPADLCVDNADHLNGHHKISLNNDYNQHLNGNDDSTTMDSLGFEFNVGVDPDKAKDNDLIQNFERIQKDTTDFCNIQVYQSQTEMNPFASESNEELLERLKSKERDPMSMSFYQEKDDDTSEQRESPELVDLNAVQPLPDSEDEDSTAPAADKENCAPDLHYNHLQHDTQPLLPAADLAHIADTPESHKLLFEQIPEIPDGKTSGLGFASDDLQDDSEADPRLHSPRDDFAQDVDMETKVDDAFGFENQNDLKDHKFDEDAIEETLLASPTPVAAIDDNQLIDVPHHVQDYDFDSALVDDVPASSELGREPVESDPSHIYENGADHYGYNGDIEDVKVPFEAPIASEMFDNVLNLENKQNQEFLESTDLTEQYVPEDVASFEQHQASESCIVAEDPVILADTISAMTPEPERIISPVDPQVESPVPCDPSPVPQAATPVPCDPSPVPQGPSPVPCDPSPVPQAASPVPCDPSPVPQVPSPVPVTDTAEIAAVSPAPDAASPVPETADLPEPSVPSPVPQDVAASPVPFTVEESKAERIEDIAAESHAQEICMPVTSELPLEPAVTSASPAPADLLLDTPIAADTAVPTDAVVAAAAVGAAAAVTAVAASAASKKGTVTKKPSPTKSTPAPKTPLSKASPAPKTPVSKPTPKTAAAKPSPLTKATPDKTATPKTSTISRTSAPSTKAAAPAAKPATARAAPVAAKPTGVAARPASATTKTATATTARPAPKRPSTTSRDVPAPAAKPAPISRPTTAKAPAAPRSTAPAAPRTAAPRAAPAAARPAPAKPAPARPAAAPRAAPAPRPDVAARAPAAAARAPPQPDRKPLSNGEARAPIRRPAPGAVPPLKSSSTTTTARARPALDKPGKELANKRVLAQPPSRPITKAPAKSTAPKPVPKKNLESKKLEENKVLTNGEAKDIEKVSEGALLPDVIA